MKVMSTTPLSWVSGCLCVWALAALNPASARILDDFNDNTKTGWGDFTFQPGFGIPVEAGGRFTFTQPPAGQPIFSGSAKTSEAFVLKDGRTIEFRVDLVRGNGPDAFAVLGFIPTTNSLGTLAGYGLAKSTTDILVTKGIGKYFHDQNPTPAIKNENVTLVLSLTGSGNNVIIITKVLDKDNQNAVLFEQTFVDTPSEDVLVGGKDTDPSTPYLTSGYFSLYLYQDFNNSAPQDSYEVVFDRAEVYVLDTVVLDDFNSNVKTDWSDFTFVPGLGIPVVANGQFKFVQLPAGQSLFSASTKTSRSFELKDGERVELSVDLVSGNGPDAFAVLAFIPTANSASTLAGYGLAKSTSDVLITKGIGKYFYNENPTPAIKNENVTLVLSLTGSGSDAIITGKVLDKDNQNAVLFEQTFVDTPGEDVMSDGKDQDPSTPYLTSGYFVLYLYQDFSSSAPQESYEVVFDNAMVSAAPPPANAPPSISDIVPASFANYLPASTTIAFKVNDDKPLVNEKIRVNLNGQWIASTNGLTITGTGNSRSVSLGGLAANVNYLVEIRVTDSDGSLASALLYFDTFLSNNLVIESEDYNFNGGQYIDNPAIIPEGAFSQAGSYGGQLGVRDVDFADTRTGPNNFPYRVQDPVGTARSLDLVRAKFSAAGGAAQGVYDYDLGEVAAGEFLNYTRTFPAGFYDVYLREAVVNMNQAEAVLEKVTGNPSQPNQSTRILGKFFGQRSGFQYRNFPLMDGLGQNRITLHLSGVETLRLRQATTQGDGTAVYQNYFVLVPVADPGPQPAVVVEALPAPDSTVATLSPAISVAIQNRDTAVQANSIRLSLNGVAVTPVISPKADGVLVNYSLSPLPPSGTTNRVELVFADNQNLIQTNVWSFALAYLSLESAYAHSGTGLDRGFNVRVVQAPSGSNLENSLQRAESQLAPGSTIPRFYESNVVDQIINYSQNGPGSADGAFPDDLLIPGLDLNANGSDDIAMEITTYLELTSGAYRFGVVCDDGYQIASGSRLNEVSAPVLSFHNGGPANETFEFYVPQSGLYPFRMVWYERGGGAHVEWFSENPTTGQRTLINDPAAANPVRAFITISEPEVVLQSSSKVTGPFEADANATLDASKKTITALKQSTERFYRLIGKKSSRIISIRTDASNVILTYE